MKTTIPKLNIGLLILLVSQLNANSPGFYKDLFMDGGVALTSRTYLRAADSLGLSMEYLATESESVQSNMIISNTDDNNGRLLYPDGSPRFRVIYTNGGRATDHGTSLGEEGRNRIRQFYYNGGSYTGSCAGAYLACLSWDFVGVIPEYYHIWPGRTAETGLYDSYTGHFVTPESPLLNYFDFGGDFYIPNIRHNGGCYAREDLDYPPETEVLLRYDYQGLSMHQKASTWAYKTDDSTGRVVVTGSHPEIELDGEGLHLMEAILLYALDGTGNPQLKGELVNAQTRIMDRATEDTLPAFTKIGDKQYHHFMIDLPQGVSDLTLTLEGDDGFDLHLFLDADTFAFEPNTDFSSNQPGADQSITVPSLSSGIWYAGVECATTVNTAGQIYYGDLSVLNGVAYSITATWDTLSVGTTTGLVPLANEYQLHQNYPNPFNPTTTIQYELPVSSFINLSVFDLLGARVTTLINGFQPAGRQTINWNGRDENGIPVSAGVYIYQLKGAGFSESRKMILLK